VTEEENKPKDIKLSKKPSKKIVSLFIITAACVFAVIVAFGQEKSGKAINFASNMVAGEKVDIPENPDWQTDLGKVSEDLAPIEIEGGDEGPKTLTEEMSVSLMSNYLSMKESGTLTPETALKLVDQTDEFLWQYGLDPYTEKDLRIIPDNGLVSIQKYGEDVGNALRNNKTTQIKNELEIFKEAVETNNPEKVKDLLAVALVYEEISAKLLQTSVPKKFVKAHIDMLNGLRGVSLALKDLSKLFVDPVLGLEGMRKYQASANLYFQARTATAQYLLLSQINYKQGSGGYYLIYGI